MLDGVHRNVAPPKVLVRRMAHEVANLCEAIKVANFGGQSSVFASTQKPRLEAEQRRPVEVGTACLLTVHACFKVGMPLLAENSRNQLWGNHPRTHVKEATLDGL
jgi:hypothetical protein